MTFEERRRMADLELWKMLSRTFPGLVRNVRFEHYDAGLTRPPENGGNDHEEKRN